MPSYNYTVDSLRESPTRKIDALREELARKGEDIILLSTGQPSIPPPRWAREKLAKELLEENMKLYSYTPSRGRKSVLEALLEELREAGVPLQLGNLALTAGGQNALYAVINTIVRPGDRVAVFDPMYFGYWPLLEYAGARTTIIYERLDEGFQPPIAELEEILKREEHNAVIIVTPDNPTGRVLDPRRARELASLAEKYDLWLVVDEAYRTLVYEGEHSYLYSYAPDHVIAVGAFSKDPGVPGWRLGYIYGPEWIIRKASLLSQETVYCPPSIAQRLVEIYLRNRERRWKHIETVKQVYMAKRDALIKAVDEYLPAAKYVRPSGGMFLFLDLEEYLKVKYPSAGEFARRLLTEEKVATVPGEYFSTKYMYGLRLSFVSETEERLTEAVRRIARLLGEPSG